MSSGVLNIAHRGASAEEPGNSLRAFWLAAEQGADMVECDVRASRDRRLVVVHDPVVELPDGRQAPVEELEFEVLRTIDLGKGERIPALEEVLGLMRAIAGVAVELKVEGLEEATSQLLRSHSLTGPVLVASFLPSVLRRMARVAPGIATSLIVGPADGRDPRAWYREKNPTTARRRAKADGLFIHTRRIDPPLVRKLRKEGVPVAVWPVDDPDEMRLLAELEVAGIITNRPALLARILA